MKKEDTLTIQSSLTSFKEVEFIRKEALLEELDRLISELIEEGEDTMFEQGRISAFEDIKLFINESIDGKAGALIAAAIDRLQAQKGE